DRPRDNLARVFDRFALVDSVASIDQRLDSGERTFIITANPEFVMLCREDPEVAAIAERADLVVPDGTGAVVASRLLGDPLPGRAPGRLLVDRLAAVAQEPRTSLALLRAHPAARASAPAAAPAARAAALRGPGPAGADASRVSVALAHEYFSAHGGAERVVEVFHRMYPDAPVYTFFHDRAKYGPLDGYALRTSFLQSTPHGGGMH